MKKKVLAIDHRYSVEIDSVDEAEWFDIINLFEDATIYQSYAYGNARWGSKNLSHIILKDGDETVAATQLVIKKMPIINIGVAYSPWGPLWKIKNKKTNKVYLEIIVNALVKEYVENRGLLLRCSPCDIFGDEEVISIYNNVGFKKESGINPYRTLLIDMTRSLEDLRIGLDPKWRNKLSKALKNDLEVIKGSSDSDYNIFLDLQKEMQDRKKYIPGVDYHEFRKISSALQDSQKMKIFICKHEGRPISTAIVSLIGNRGIYLLGATANSGLHLHGSNLIQWRIIEWLKEQNCTCYDLGGICPETNLGVYRFKNGLTGKNGKEVFHIGQYSISKNFESYLTVRIIESLRNIMGRFIK